MNDCIFCKIIEGAIPSTKVYEDVVCLAFLDIHPQAAYHAVLIPKRHIASLAEAGDDDRALLGHLMLSCTKIAREAGLDKGFRVVTNIGEYGAQSVGHLHFHILGGQQLGDKLV